MQILRKNTQTKDVSICDHMSSAENARRKTIGKAVVRARLLMKQNNM